MWYIIQSLNVHQMSSKSENEWKKKSPSGPTGHDTVITKRFVLCSPRRFLPKECCPRRRQAIPADSLLSLNRKLPQCLPSPSLFTHTGDDASHYGMEPSVCLWDANVELFPPVAAVSWSSWRWRAAEQEVCQSARSTDSWRKTSLILRYNHSVFSSFV